MISVPSDRGLVGGAYHHNLGLKSDVVKWGQQRPTGEEHSGGMNEAFQQGAPLSRHRWCDTQWGAHAPHLIVQQASAQVLVLPRHVVIQEVRKSLYTLGHVD